MPASKRRDPDEQAAISNAKLDELRAALDAMDVKRTAELLDLSARLVAIDQKVTPVAVKP